MNQSSAPLTLDLIADQHQQSALELLCNASGLSKQRIKDAMNKGAVWYTRRGKTQRLRRATQTLDKGTRIQLFYDAAILACKPETPALIAHHNRYSLWYKPHGLMAQGSQWGDHCSLLRWVEVNAQPRRPAFLVHRLDADAAGLMLIAHDSQSAARLSALFQSRDILKHYQAWASGLLPLNNAITLDQDLDGKHAVTHIQCVVQDTNQQKSLIDILIETGRKHQIRRHLANAGHPLIGDKLYGQATSLPLQLLAYRLQFTCPFTNRAIDCELPNEQKFSSNSG